MSRAFKFAPHLRELRIHLCQSSEPSKGAREFIQNHYVPLKRNNPRFPILIRECFGVQPRLWVRYEGGKESSISLSNLKADDIFRQVEILSKS